MSSKRSAPSGERRELDATAQQHMKPLERLPALTEDLAASGGSPMAATCRITQCIGRSGRESWRGLKLR